jgi:predicted unusual protein kinase regulating ubiquinone biosynthesis (AarF/ABC1/UbiB family)
VPFVDQLIDEPGRRRRVKKDEIKSSRLGRARKLTGAAAGVAARETAARWISATGRPPARQAQADRQRLKTAESLVKVFAGMRGAAMKVGQTLSAVDLGLVPEEIRPEFQAILAQLQEGAEPVPFRAIRGVVEDDLGDRLGRTFADFGEEPIAAASIGQVHRATLKDGTDVAVKVQYPGIAEAIHSDLQNLRLALKLLSAVAPGVNTAAIAGEIRERIGDELDYELEATNQRAMARVYRGHPFVVVPDVVPDLCGERVLVSEYVAGARFASMLDAPQADRDRIGEIVVRFYLNGPMRHRLLNGDPHPGNALFLDDGRVAFVDFGFFKRLRDADVGQLVAITQATYADDAQRLLDVVAGLGALPPDPTLAEPFLDSYKAIFGWLLVDHPTTVDPASTAEMMRRYEALRSADGFGGLTLPAEHFVLMRAVFLLIGLLGQLRARGTWLDVAGEWLFAADPATDLGREEADFFAPRHCYDLVEGSCP